jgi:hypothetical protein
MADPGRTFDYPHFTKEQGEALCVLRPGEPASQGEEQLGQVSQMLLGGTSSPVSL